MTSLGAIRTSVGTLKANLLTAIHTREFLQDRQTHSLFYLFNPKEAV